MEREQEDPISLLRTPHSLVSFSPGKPSQFLQKAWSLIIIIIVCILLGAYVPGIMLITLGLSSQHRSKPTVSFKG